MITAWVITGSGDVGEMVNGPLPVEMSKSILSTWLLASALTFPMAHPSVPVLPSSSVLFTVNTESIIRVFEPQYRGLEGPSPLAGKVRPGPVFKKRRRFPCFPCMAVPPL